MNVQSIDLGHELRQGVHSCLDLAPVIICRPIARQCLNRRELYSLRRIWNRFSLRPPCRVDAPAQFSKFRFRNIINMKQTNSGLVSCRIYSFPWNYFQWPTLNYMPHFHHFSILNTVYTHSPVINYFTTLQSLRRGCIWCQ